MASIQHYLLCFPKMYRSNGCPECRNVILEPRRVIWNISTSDKSIDSRQNTQMKKFEKIIDLNRQQIVDLTMKTQHQQADINTLIQTLNEMSRQKRLKAAEDKIQIRNLEVNVDYQRKRYQDLQKLAQLKDRTINELNSALKLRESKDRNDSSQLAQLQAENAALTDRLTLMNQCVNTMNLGDKFTEIVNRRASRVMTVRKRKYPASSDRRKRVSFKEFWSECLLCYSVLYSLRIYRVLKCESLAFGLLLFKNYCKCHERRIGSINVSRNSSFRIVQLIFLINVTKRNREQNFKLSERLLQKQFHILSMFHWQYWCTVELMSNSVPRVDHWPVHFD